MGDEGSFRYLFMNYKDFECFRLDRFKLLKKGVFRVGS